MTGDCEVPPARRVKPNARREGNYNMPSVVGNGGCGFVTPFRSSQSVRLPKTHTTLVPQNA